MVPVATFLPGVALLACRGAGSLMLGPPDMHPSLELLFEQSSDPVFILDPREDRILDANAAGCRVLPCGSLKSSAFNGVICCTRKD